MKLSETKKFFLDYHRSNSKKNTLLNYERLISRSCIDYGDREIQSITSDDVLYVKKPDNAACYCTYAVHGDEWSMLV